MEHLIKKIAKITVVIVALILFMLFLYYLSVMRAFSINYTENNLTSRQFAYEYFVKVKSLEKTKIYEVVLLHQDYWNFSHIFNKFLSFFVTDLPLGNSTDSVFEIEVYDNNAVLKNIKVNKLISSISLEVDSKTFNIPKELNYSGHIIKNLEVVVYDSSTKEKWSYRIAKIDLNRVLKN